MHRKHNRSRRKTGSEPGSLLKHDFAQDTRVQLTEFNQARHEHQVLDPSVGLNQLLSRRQPELTRFRPRRTVGNAAPVAAAAPPQPVNLETLVTWINIDGLANIELLHALGEIFGLHALALEDVVNVHQHAKTEAYDTNLFMVVRMPLADQRFATEQVSLFLMDGLVITLQEYAGDCLDPVRDRLARNKGRIRSRGADYLAYAIIDAVIDGYFPVLDRYDEELQGIGNEIDENPRHDVPKRLHDIRADLLNIRKVAQQHRDAVSTLLREESFIISEDTRFFLRDCLDHIGRLIEAADTQRETCGELRELYFAQLGQKTNDVMKVLTIVATVFIPMSFIAGVYGMNFDTSSSPFNMPELHWMFGYPFAIALMLFTGGGLLVYLKRNGLL